MDTPIKQLPIPQLKPKILKKLAKAQAGQNVKFLDKALSEKFYNKYFALTDSKKKQARTVKMEIESYYHY